MERVSIIGSFVNVIKALREQSEGNEIKTIMADREAILKKYGDKRLLGETMAEKEFSRVSKDKGMGIRARIKATGGANGGNGMDRPMQLTEQTIESDRDR